MIFKNFNVKFLIGVISLSVIIGCNNGRRDSREAYIESGIKSTLSINQVEIIELEKIAFNQEIISNGKLKAIQKSILQFIVSGNLIELNVKEGDQVHEGQVLASLNNFRYIQELEQAEINLKKTRLELEDMLVGRGYNMDNIEGIPPHIYEMATLRVGFQEALYQQKIARFNINSTTLKAPFSGKAGNIRYKEFEQIDGGSEFLTLIDDTAFEVVFNIIESELDEVTVGSEIEVVIFSSGRKYHGVVIGINPIVEENGTLEVTAKVTSDGKLIEGMNVKVIVRNLMADEFVVPKSAVIMRQGQEVVFKVINGKAFWTYVKVTNENHDSYAIVPDPDKSTAVLNIGDSIIISNNVNLAHLSEVIVKETPSDKI